ncbi:DUF58 domain-containing protein [Dethiobacter alkaliphilus]|uniref:DUF58 domain-containing protein n=1 Tax=Dethiobacter alkaliphilus AHT 1 TaxID=555088 RepID=C0GFK8_DETAL|nr:DUF58 domain-containing protein [Dethiobacter alkaliphilus]EEG77968.1 protein of unknown function DUF58 [Dethiobacter alkaliphilus AHT 1]
MVSSPRLIAIVFSGAAALFFLILAASISTTQAMALFILYNAVTGVLLLADRRLTPTPGMLQIDRTFEHRFSLGADNPVTITAANRSSADLTLTIKDEPPFSFQASAKTITGKLPASSQATFRYTLNPPKRGDYLFGSINLRYPSRLGLFIWQSSLPLENNMIRVYPNIREIRKYQILTQRSHLVEAGLKRSRATGLGTDFESLRDYQIDDTYRRINWGATARRGRLTVNQYTVDRSQNILLVLDAGRLMSGTITTLSKLDHAVNTSLLLGYVGVTHDDNVGMISFADEVKTYLPPRKGQPQLQKILAGLYNLQPQIVESDYQAVCRYIGFRNRKRSLICFFTDLIDDESSRRLITHLSSLTGKHLVLCITMLDQQIVKQAEKTPEDSLELYQKAVAQTVLRNRREAISILKSNGVVVVDVPPDELSVATINKYLELKSQSRL